MKSFLDFEEKNVEKAVQKACADLNVTRDKLKYDIISHGSSGIFGLVGTKKALIRVFVPDLQNRQSGSVSVSAAGMEGSLDADSMTSDKDTVSALVDEAFGEIKESPRPKLKPRQSKKPVKADRPANKTAKKPDKKPEKPEAVQETVTPAPETTVISDTTTPSSAQVTDTETVSKPVEPAPKSAAAEVNPENSAAAVAVAQELAGEIFKTMAIDAQMSVNSDADQNWINVKVGEPGILIGKRGQTLEAIQYLVDKVVNKQCGKGNRVIVDVEGYVESRKTELKDLAARLASKAVKTGKPSTMTRMNAHDRRIVHVALKRNRSVRTQSVGDGYYRKLIIFPKKKSPKKTDSAKSKQ